MWLWTYCCDDSNHLIRQFSWYKWPHVVIIKSCSSCAKTDMQMPQPTLKGTSFSSIMAIGSYSFQLELIAIQWKICDRHAVLYTTKVIDFYVRICICICILIQTVFWHLILRWWNIETTSIPIAKPHTIHCIARCVKYQSELNTLYRLRMMMHCLSKQKRNLFIFNFAIRTHSNDRLFLVPKYWIAPCFLARKKRICMKFL